MMFREVHFYVYKQVIPEVEVFQFLIDISIINCLTRAMFDTLKRASPALQAILPQTLKISHTEIQNTRSWSSLSFLTKWFDYSKNKVDHCCIFVALIKTFLLRFIYRFSFNVSRSP